MIEGQEPIVIPYLETVTNNVGEYKAVQFALLEASEQKHVKSIEILTDSLLVVNQVNGLWKCRKPHLLPFLHETKALIKELQATLSWITREENPAGKVLG